MISIERPYAFIALFVLVPVILYTYFRYRKVAGCLSGMTLNSHFRDLKNIRDFRFIMILRTVFRLMAAVCAVLAYAGISWGTKTISVQKSGDAVCLVFDISYSMTARDCPEGLSRLDASRNYALKLLDRMEDSPVSVVLAKGDGVIAVPVTQDRQSVEQIIDCLSPELMTSSGSSIGKGILAAMQSFPKNMSQASHIWVFTDGDETDSSLSSALEDAARFGFPVTLIGFGTANPVEITAGDGKTRVKTFLNAPKMIDAAANAGKKAAAGRGTRASDIITYVAADSEGSAWVLLKQLTGKTAAGEVWETQGVSHHQLFILLAILFFMASYFTSEFDLMHIITMRSSSVMILVCMLFCFTSCSSQKESVLSGVFCWYQKKYQSATAQFLRSYNQADSENDSITKQYCAYNLASTYIMQDEYEASLYRLGLISPDAPEKLKSAAYYNMGIIANRRGQFDAACEYFKKAVIEDSSNLDAKINLEFTQQQVESLRSKSLEKQMAQASIDKNQDTLAQGVFNMIQQEEKERWKKLQSNKKESSSVDY